MAPQVSQFGDPALTQAEAISACGPAAALAFSRAVGRNPTLREALDLAKGVGWTAEAGMAGPQSQQQLLEKMGVRSELTPTADWGRVTADVAAGKPVIISTPRHYFTASSYDPQKGYYVGTSGTDLKGGAEWMTAEQITSAGRGVNGALHLTTPTGAPRAPATTTHPSAVEAHRGAIQAAFGDLGPDVVENFLGIVGKESTGNAAARKNDAIEDSVGIGQVNQRVHPHLAQKYDLTDPAQNAKAMREIYDQQGYGAWHTASSQLGLLGTPRARQQFLEANSPGESTTIHDARGVGGSVKTPDAASSSTTTPPEQTGGPLAPAGLPAWMRALQQQDAYARRIGSQMEAPTLLAPLQLPPLGLPGFRPTRPFQLPFGGR